MAAERLTKDATTEEGFGLIEIVVSMFILALLAIAFLPTLIQGLRLSATNATIATATQSLSDELEYVQSLGSICDTVASADGAAPNVTDPRGVVLLIDRNVAACPTNDADYPTTVEIDITVVRQDTAATVAEATTLVYVSAKS